MVTLAGTHQAPLVKICGIKTLSDFQLAADSGADFLGVIFAESKRQVALAEAERMGRWLEQFRSTRSFAASEPAPAATPDAWFHRQAHCLAQPPRPKLVGVFRNQSLEHILAVLERVPLDVVQLHGDEDISMANAIPIPVFKVFHVDDHFNSYAQVATAGFHHMALLDAKVAGGAGSQGGQGVAFNWALAEPVAHTGQPFVLAGGLRPDNVTQAIQQARPWMVDVSSGVETDGAKDPQKLRDFVAAVKVSTECS
ncbi:anthranilate synthase / indole-3-glycerol phosphate synthase [Dimargaris xerosporica]|nr:anthranilate synthase / indole-3-glycerol phosphate synthase [Dimargaris xerosporica]